MINDLPRYKKPPVTEVVLSLQFTPLKKFTAAHFGWFWREFLGSQWGEPHDAPRLPSQFEQVSGDLKFAKEAFEIRNETIAERIQLVNNDRMVQVQDNRFILNWRKGDGPYPSYRALREDFNNLFPKFQAFAKDAGFGDISVNQWDIAYINFVPKGVLWTSPSDWRKLIPRLLGSLPDAPCVETCNADLKFVISDFGRLYVSVKHAKLVDESQNLMLQLAARGPADSETWGERVEFGHEAIVRFFTDVTSPEAHKHWERTV